MTRIQIQAVPFEWSLERLLGFFFFNNEKKYFPEWKLTVSKGREEGEEERFREAAWDPGKSRPLDLNTGVGIFIHFVTLIKLLKYPKL